MKNKRENHVIENKIFHLRQKASKFLQAGDTDSFNEIQSTIAHLQQASGVTHGAERKKDNERTA